MASSHSDPTIARISASSDTENSQDSRTKAKEVAMAKLIEFYIPQNIRRPKAWAPKLHRRKVLELHPRTKMSTILLFFVDGLRLLGALVRDNFTFRDEGIARRDSASGGHATIRQPKGVALSSEDAGVGEAG